jgi:hypothetical protein
VGIYPPGSVVELNSGHVGVVMEINHGSLLTPVIKLVADSKGVISNRPKLVNLKDYSSGEMTIKRVIPPAEAGFDPAYYFSLKEAGQ